MQGLFRANGGCGYVKKPDILLKDGSDNEVFDPRRKLQVKQTLKVGEIFLRKDILIIILLLLPSKFTCNKRSGQDIHGRRLAFRLQAHPL